MERIYDMIEVSHREQQFVAVANGKAYAINECFYLILSSLKKDATLEEAVGNLEQFYNLDCNDKQNIVDSFQSFIRKISTTVSTVNNSYIKFQHTLLRSSLVVAVSRLFKVLFGVKIFWLVFVLASIVNILFFVLIDKDGISLSLLSFSLGDFLILFMLSNAFVLLHELGHSTASLRNGIQPGKIGFGFYLIFPVLFSDVTKSWLLPRRKRLVVNAGGVYFQLIVNVLLMSGYVLGANSASENYLRYLILSNTLVILYSLLPFFRNDGYWVYSDLFDIPNLIEKADNFRWKDKQGRFSLPILQFAILNWFFRGYIALKLLEYVVSFIMDLHSPYFTLQYLKSFIVSVACCYGFYKLVLSMFKLCSMNKIKEGY